MKFLFKSICIFFNLVFLVVGKPDDNQKVSSFVDKLNFSLDLLINDDISQNHCDIKLCLKKNYGPLSPFVPCDHLPMDFIECEEMVDHQGNETSLLETAHGCLRMGGPDSYLGSRLCRVLSNIECFGNRTFVLDGFPCLRNSGHYFLTTLLFSLLLGFLGMDRFYLGHTGTAIGKLLTIGGVGIWWIIDIVLLVTGNLLPEDGSSWNEFV